MWRGIICFSGESGPGIFRAEPGRMEEVGEGASSLPGRERLNGPTTGCVPGEAVAFASSPSLAGRGRRIALGWGGPGAAGSRGRLEGCAPRLGRPPLHSSAPPARGPARVWVLAACQGAPGLLSAFERVELPTPGSSARTPLPGARVVPCSLVCLV